MFSPLLVLKEVSTRVSSPLSAFCGLNSLFSCGCLEILYCSIMWCALCNGLKQTAIDFDSSPVSRTGDGIFNFKALSFLDKS